MAKKDFIADNIKIVQNSIFNFGELYKMIFRWFEVYEYDHHEDRYDEETKPDGKDVRVYWTAEKKIDAYTMFVIELNMYLLGLSATEIERNGLKSKTNKGNIEFRISVYLKKDYTGKWQSFPLMAYVYDRIIAKKRLDRYEGEIYGDYKKLIDEIKAFLSLHHL
tara:strand:- start:863 stop:1354 length:492 start_codon:yes stop_codon:yes gene_type:complete